VEIMDKVVEKMNELKLTYRVPVPAPEEVKYIFEDIIDQCIQIYNDNKRKERWEE
jgi:hypothetical protein